jgi:hypothetical protein
MIEDCKRISDVATSDCISLNNGQMDSALQSLKAKLQEYKDENACPNVRKPDVEEVSCDGECRPKTSGPPIDVNGDGKVDGDDCGMPAVFPLIPCSRDVGNTCGGGDTARNLNQQRQVSGFVMMVITEVEEQAGNKYVKAFPLCGIRMPGAPTGPGPTCDPKNPVCCATEPVLVNASL